MRKRVRNTEQSDIQGTSATVIPDIATLSTSSAGPLVYAHMKLAEFRHELESYRQQADQEAERSKDSFIVRDRMLQLYSRFDAHERLMANEVFNEWALSEDEAVRFDALGLIRDLKIVTATPSLRELAERLGREQSPGAPFELEKVERIIAEIIQTGGVD
jgi:hypothetical protein